MKHIDLNLMRVLDALLTAGSVTGAAERLHLSVPATSHALARLREAAGDPLFVRAGRQFVPTARAQALREPVARWMAEAAQLLTAPSTGSLETTARRFVVRGPDGIPIAFGAALATAMAHEMPRAELQFVPESFDDGAALREGRIDVDIGPLRPREPEVRVHALFTQRPVAVVRRGHALAAQAVTARRYAAQRHVAVIRGPQALSAVDDALAAQGLSRQVVMSVVHANVTPMVAAGSELVATVSERMAQAMAPSLGLVVLPLPFVAAPEPLMMAWHPRHDAEPAHRWLRETLVRVIAEVVEARRAAERSAERPAGTLVGGAKGSVPRRVAQGAARRP